MSWLRYEKIDEAANNLKFWEIGPVRAAPEPGTYGFATRWGRIGTKGQEKTYFYAARSTAQITRDMKIRDKKGEGYKLVVPGVSVAPAPEQPKTQGEVEAVLTERSIILGGE